ncbi:MAG: hypothetical protein ACYDHM_03755 [Acidiferrobacterales bacterium]
MRHRIYGNSSGIGPAISDHMVLFTVVLSLLIGAVLVRLGMYGRQRWLVFWGASLVLAALIYIVAMWLGYA